MAQIHFLALCLLLLVSTATADAPALRADAVLAHCFMGVVSSPNGSSAVVPPLLGATCAGNDVFYFSLPTEPNTLFRCSLAQLPSSAPLAKVADGIDVVISPPVPPSVARLDNITGWHNATISRCFADPAKDRVVVITGNDRSVWEVSTARFDAPKPAPEVNGRSMVGQSIHTAGFADGSWTATFGRLADVTKSGIHDDIFFVVDAQFHSIRTISAAPFGLRTVTTLAGDVNNGLEGDADGAGANARLRSPFSVVAIGKFLFVADRPPTTTSSVWRLRKVNTESGVLSTIHVAASSRVSSFLLRPFSASDATADEGNDGSSCASLILDAGPFLQNSSGLSLQQGSTSATYIAAINPASGLVSVSDLVVESSGGTAVVGAIITQNVTRASNVAMPSTRVFAVGFTQPSVSTATTTLLQGVQLSFPPQRSDICHVSCSSATSQPMCQQRVSCFWDSWLESCTPACWSYASSSSCPSGRCTYTGGRCQPNCGLFSGSSDNNDTCVQQNPHQCAWTPDTLGCITNCPSPSGTGPICSGTCTAATAACASACESFSDSVASCVGHADRCQWLGAAAGGCKPRCEQLGQDACLSAAHCMVPSTSSHCIVSCSVLTANATACGASPFCFFDTSANICRRVCEKFANEACPSAAYSSSSAHSNLYTFGNNASASDCFVPGERAVTSAATTCMQNCHTIAEASICNSYTSCYNSLGGGEAAVPSGCLPKCREMRGSSSSAPSSSGNNACATYCSSLDIVHPSLHDRCHANCTSLDTEGSCVVNECQWSRGTCRFPCTILSFDACFMNDHCTTTTLNVDRWVAASQCVFTCGNLDQGLCGGVAHCYWSGISCQDRCSSLQSQGAACNAKRSCFVGAGDACFQDCSVLSATACAAHPECLTTTSGFCRNRCITQPFDIITTGSGYGYEGKIYSCLREDCSFLPAPHGCFPRCELHATEQYCTSDDCAWTPSGCAPDCTRLSAYQCNVQDSCTVVPGVSPSSSDLTICVASCKLFNSEGACTSTTSGRCLWRNDTAECVARCDQFLLRDGCPTSCAADAAVFFDPLAPPLEQKCRPKCTDVLDADACTNTSCVWSHGACRMNCDWLSKTACGEQPHCFDPHSAFGSPHSEAEVNTTYTSAQCLINCHVLPSDQCNSSFAAEFCIWAGNSCVPKCAQIPTEAAYCPTHTYDGGLCVNGTEGCMQTCSILPQDSCESLKECVWDGVSRCLLRCQYTRENSCAPSETRCFWGHYGTCAQNCTSLEVDICVKHSECLVGENGLCINKCKSINHQTVQFGYGYAYEGKIYSCMRDDCSFLPAPHGCFPRCELHATEQYCTNDDCAWIGNQCVSQCEPLSSIQCAVTEQCSETTSEIDGQSSSSQCQQSCSVHNVSSLCATNDRCLWSLGACVPRCLAVPVPADCPQATPAPTPEPEVTPTPAPPPPTTAVPEVSTAAPTPEPVVSTPEPESTPTPETPAPPVEETPAPPTPAPDTPAPAPTDAPPTDAPSTPEPVAVETPVPATPAPATPQPPTNAPDTPVPETPAPTPAPVDTTPEPTPEPTTITTDEPTPVPETPVPETPAPPIATTAAPVPVPDPTSERKYNVTFHGAQWKLIVFAGTDEDQTQVIATVTVAIASALQVDVGQIKSVELFAGSLIVRFSVWSDDTTQPDLADTAVVEKKLNEDVNTAPLARLYESITGGNASDVRVTGAKSVVIVPPTDAPNTSDTPAPDEETPAPNGTMPAEEPAADDSSWCGTECIIGFGVGGAVLVIIVIAACCCCGKSSKDGGGGDLDRNGGGYGGPVGGGGGGEERAAAYAANTGPTMVPPASGSMSPADASPTVPPGGGFSNVGPTPAASTIPAPGGGLGSLAAGRGRGGQGGGAVHNNGASPAGAASPGGLALRPRFSQQPASPAPLATATGDQTASVGSLGGVAATTPQTLQQQHSSFDSVPTDPQNTPTPSAVAARTISPPGPARQSLPTSPGLHSTSSDASAAAQQQQLASPRLSTAPPAPLVATATALQQQQQLPPTSPVPSAPPPAVNAEWECPVCTFKNDAGNNSCEICEADRPGGAVAAPAMAAPPPLTMPAAPLQRSPSVELHSPAPPGNGFAATTAAHGEGVSPMPSTPGGGVGGSSVNRRVMADPAEGASVPQPQHQASAAAMMVSPQTPSFTAGSSPALPLPPLGATTGAPQANSSSNNRRVTSKSPDVPQRQFSDSSFGGAADIAPAAAPSASPVTNGGGGGGSQPPLNLFGN